MACRTSCLGVSNFENCQSCLVAFAAAGTPMAEQSALLAFAQAMMEAQGPRPTYAEFGVVPISNPWSPREELHQQPSLPGCTITLDSRAAAVLAAKARVRPLRPPSSWPPHPSSSAPPISVAPAFQPRPCSTVAHLPYATRLSVARFQADFEDASRPALLGGLMADWPAAAQSADVAADADARVRRARERALCGAGALTLSASADASASAKALRVGGSSASADAGACPAAPQSLPPPTPKRSRAWTISNLVALLGDHPVQVRRSRRRRRRRERERERERGRERDRQTDRQRGTYQQPATSRKSLPLKSQP